MKTHSREAKRAETYTLLPFQEELEVTKENAAIKMRWYKPLTISDTLSLSIQNSDFHYCNKGLGRYERPDDWELALIHSWRRKDSRMVPMTYQGIEFDPVASYVTSKDVQLILDNLRALHGWVK